MTTFNDTDRLLDKEPDDAEAPEPETTAVEVPTDWEPTTDDELGDE